MLALWILTARPSSEHGPGSGELSSSEFTQRWTTEAIVVVVEEEGGEVCTGESGLLFTKRIDLPF